MVIQIADIVTGLMVLMALVLRFKYRWVWFVYAVACWSYSVLNISVGLPAEGVIDVIAGGISAWNFLMWKKKDS